MLTKREQRQKIRALKSTSNEDEQAEESKRIMECVLSHPKVKASEVILMYYSLPDEVDTHAAIDTLCQEGKIVLLPKIIDNEHLELRRYTGMSDMTSGQFGIMEPVGTPFASIKNVDVAIVPGMSFDSQCHRLGRGKGYYDRLLSQMPRTYIIGVCFEFQKCENLPCDKHDIQMDEIISQ